MLGRFATWLAVKLLEVADLDTKHRIALTNAMVSQLGAIPAKAVIEIADDGRISIEGRPLEMEMAMKLRESARAILDSYARRVISEQVAFRAVSLAILNGDTPEKMMFGRAAIWQLQQVEELLRLLAQE